MMPDLWESRFGFVDRDQSGTNAFSTSTEMTRSHVQRLQLSVPHSRVRVQKRRGTETTQIEGTD